eukprot:2051607-Rhodomonas_salina.2
MLSPPPWLHNFELEPPRLRSHVTRCTCACTADDAKTDPRKGPGWRVEDSGSQSRSEGRVDGLKCLGSRV